jgi:hypothetical protein
LALDRSDVRPHPTIDALLDDWRDALGGDYTAYRNHAQRVFHLAASHSRASEHDRERLAIAAAFHDVGIWLDGTFDYIEPSARRAEHFLAGSGRPASIPLVCTMIREHHKITPWRGADAHLVEAFRRADWLDVCLFMLPTRIPSAQRSKILATFPRAGFHRRLVELGSAWGRRHPLRPLPMLKP